MPKNKQKSNLGASLQKQKNRRFLQVKKYFQQHGEVEQDQNFKEKLKSMTVGNQIQDFIYETKIDHNPMEIKDKSCIYDNELKVIIKEKKIYQGIKDQEEKRKLTEKISFIKIPRKPDWHNKTAQEYQESENQVYLEWRKEIQRLEEENPQLVITPYEKNIEVWKQLWKVIEKSDVLIQIVDARDPYFYRTEDLELYAQQNNKRILLLLNKADLLPQKVREILSKDLKSKNIEHFFYQCKQEENQDRLLDLQMGAEIKTRDELLGILNQLKEEFQFESQNKGIFTVGLIGFPNVGKSSIINSLFGQKRVGVDFKPGKTKNMQTLFLQKDLILCDCPGLTFPSISSSQSEMVCYGVLPISAMNPIETTKYIIYRSDLELIRRKYKLDIEIPNVKSLSDDQFDKVARNVLQMYSASRGHLTAVSALPDEHKAAKTILTDFILGHLDYFYLPNLDQKEEIFKELIQQKYPLQESIKIRADCQENIEQFQQSIQDLKNEKSIQSQLRMEKVKEFIEQINEDKILSLLEGKEVEGF